MPDDEGYGMTLPHPVGEEAFTSCVWVSKARACELLGLSDGKVRSKIARKWTQGIHYAIIDGGTWINLREVQAWITREASGQCEDESRSDTASAVSGLKKPSTYDRLGVV